ncbi:MAG: DUF4412 domain-containing protein [Flavipsychrobacter sp.]|jgi:hypothetical protein|nr:DUF4412 domain-containing protein [Flavipsychrobacter sp.]
MQSVQLPSVSNFYRLVLYIVSVLFGLLGMSSAFAQSLPENYEFALGVTYEMSSGKNGNLKKGEQMGMWFSNQPYTGMESPRQKGFFMVMDLKDQKLVTLMTDQKMAMVMDLKKMQEKMKGQVKEENPSDVKISKTGKSETILGYKCDQYLIETADGQSLVWITTELGSGMGNLAKSLSSMLSSGPKPMGLPSMKGIENGVLLKLESTDKKSGNNTRLEAVNVNKDGKKFPTSGYNVMAMPGM